MPELPLQQKPRETGSALGAFFSYLVPGLGQILQGRITKGLLFFVCLNGLFFYGMALGQFKNVYLPDTAGVNNPWKLSPLPANIYNRLQFAGQFWIGVAAWPAIYQYLNPGDDNGLLGKFMKTPPEEELNQLQRDGDKSWDLGWVYTVIAGVLNVLVIYDAFAGPAFAEGERRLRETKEAAA